MNNSGLGDKGVLKMDFCVNKTFIEVIRDSAFGGTYFRYLYSGINGKWYKKSWKEFYQLNHWSKAILFRLLWCQC